MYSQFRRSRTAAVLAVVAGLSVLTVATPAAAAPATAQEVLGRLIVNAESTAAYDRSYFDHWIDADGDGCDTRAEVLLEETHEEPVIGPGCSVGGLWWSFLDDVEWRDASRLDIDHQVPLEEAWQSGAAEWTAAQRRHFANDLDYFGSLNAVTDTVNASKGSRDPAEWMPPWSDGNCDYVTMWVLVKYRWNMAVDPTEKSALDGHLAAGGCGTQPIPVPEKAGTPLPDAFDDRLATDGMLSPGEQIVAPNGAYRFVMQGDGNAVVYGPTGPHWASGTGFVGSASIAMQGDGNLVVYSATGSPAWASGTGGFSGGTLIMQNDGNLVMYRSDGSPAWVNGKGMRPPGTDSLPAGTVLQTGGYLQSRNGAWRLVMQADGHAVVYGPGRIGWVSGTGGVGPAFLDMQQDGNLVVYTNSARPVWASATGGVASPTLVMQDDGNLVMYSYGAPVWVNGNRLINWNCHSAYPGVCIPPPPPDLDCWEISQRNFRVLAPDPHRFDADGNGIGCEIRYR